MIEAKRKVFRPSILLAAAAVFSLLIAAVLYFNPAGAKPAQATPLDVVKAYLKASYARDYQNAYHYISARDQLTWNKKSYASQSGSFTGFALELAQTLAANMEVWVIEKQLSPGSAHYKIGYKVPTADELSSLVFDWDPDKLNALSRPRQEQLLETLGKVKKDGKMIMVEGQETFDLVSDSGSWKIFLDWSSGIKVTVKADSGSSAAVEARFFPNELIVKKDEPFQIGFKIKNQSKLPIVVRIVHHVEPRKFEDQIDMIACGALSPLALQPGEVQEISSAYLIRNEIKTGMQITLFYELKLELPSSHRGTVSKATAPKRNAANVA